MNRRDWIQTLCIRGEKNDVLCLTMQTPAQPLQGLHGNGFVVFQIVYRSGIDSMFRNQCVGGLTLLFHCFP